jgi:hypothetical protein
MALASIPKVSNVPPIKQERYSAEEVAAALLRSKGLVTVAAQQLGCVPKTVRQYIDRYPTVAAALKEAREGILDMTEARLYQAANEGEQWAVTFVLKNLGKDRGYSERSELHHSGTIGTYIVDLGVSDGDGSAS